MNKIYFALIGLLLFASMAFAANDINVSIVAPDGAIMQKGVYTTIYWTIGDWNTTAIGNGTGAQNLQNVLFDINYNTSPSAAGGVTILNDANIANSTNGYIKCDSNSGNPATTCQYSWLVPKGINDYTYITITALDKNGNAASDVSQANRAAMNTNVLNELISASVGLVILFMVAGVGLVIFKDEPMAQALALIVMAACLVLIFVQVLGTF